MLGRSGSDLELSCGAQRVGGYRAIPGAGRGKGLLVLVAAPDGRDFARDVCDRLARAGFVALAPELAPEQAGAADHAHGLDAIFEAGVAELFNCDATEGARVGAIGFGVGGVLALRAAARQRRIGAVIDFYGADDLAPLEGVKLTSVEAPILFLFGAADAAIDSGAVRALERRLVEAGARVHLRELPQAGGGFMNEARADAFDAVAAAHAWDAALAFLGATL
ncbi:MAG: dienelactone hydrolase family protein [Myxococcales bacterium]|nr:dienelactone hydrolase family protein [Myxococcales bacterium]MDH5305981.1 dienelactone hydrolase family protein [Myxococcales bacterium]